MTDPIDIEELRVAVDAAAATQPRPRRTVPWTWPRYGNERTYGDLAFAVEQVREDVVREMERDHDPALRIGESESDAAAFERIGAETRRRWLSDRRMLILANKWGAETMVEAYRRELSFRARWSDAFLESATQHVDDRTMRATLRLATGLEDPLPTVKARQPDA